MSVFSIPQDDIASLFANINKFKNIEKQTAKLEKKLKEDDDSDKFGKELIEELRETHLESHAKCKVDRQKTINKIVNIGDKGDKGDKSYNGDQNQGNDGLHNMKAFKDAKDAKDAKDTKFIKCNGCASDHLFEIDGYNICQDCGLYNDCVIDSGQEWRYYGADDNKGVDPARADIPTNELLPHASMGSLIGFGSKETNTTKRIRNMNFWNSIPYRESSLRDTFNSITIMAHNAGISQCIVEDAKIMYKKVSDIKSSRRSKKEAMKAGCIMLACKLKGVPRSCNEISKIFKIKNNKTLRKSIKTFEEIWNNIQINENGSQFILNTGGDSDSSSESENEAEAEASASAEADASDVSEIESDDLTVNNELLKLQVQIPVNIIPTGACKSINSNSLTTLKIVSVVKPITINTKSDAKIYTYDSIKYLHRFCSTLGLDEQIYSICYNILVKVEHDKYLERHNPLSRTASILYYVIDKLDLNITKYNIVQTCEISEVTITKCYHKLIKYNDVLQHYFN